MTKGLRKDWICQKQRLEQEMGTHFLDTVHGVGAIALASKFVRLLLPTLSTMLSVNARRFRLRRSHHLITLVVGFLGSLPSSI
ncbi:MAG: hypothetical protein AAFY26_15275 [Cyanobacteria bacterium J06638_22]